MNSKLCPIESMDSSVPMSDIGRLWGGGGGCTNPQGGLQEVKKIDSFSVLTLL